MRFIPDHQVLFDHTERSFRKAIDWTADDAIRQSPYLTGDYRSRFAVSTGTTGSGSPSARIGNTHPGTRAIELGADVGPRKGPHMKGVGKLGRAGDDYIDNMGDALVRTP